MKILLGIIAFLVIGILFSLMIAVMMIDGDRIEEYLSLLYQELVPNRYLRIAIPIMIPTFLVGILVMSTYHFGN